MKLVKIYANKNFKNIEFNEEFNVVLAVITDKANKRDTHNLGKTYLTHVIDFILLGDNKRKRFEKAVFEDMIFYGELKLNNGKYLTIKRAINAATRISFKLNDTSTNGFTPPITWDHEDIPFERSKNKLNDYLEFDVVNNFNYRKSITYFLRTQQDYLDVYQLNKFKGRHKDWKPFVFELLGYDSNLLASKYELEDKINSRKSSIEILESESRTMPEERDKLVGLLDIKSQELEETTKDIDKFNFFSEDSTLNEKLIDELDTRIQILNSERYRITYEINKVKESLSSIHASIKPGDLEQLYKETGLYFSEVLIKEFNDLLEFNKSISQERKKFLEENLKTLSAEKETINDELRDLEDNKSRKLEFLTQKDSYDKFKEYQKQLSTVESELVLLEREIASIDRIKDIEGQIKNLYVELEAVATKVESTIKKRQHAEINKIFNSIIHDVLDTNAIISLKQNTAGNVDFEAHYESSVDAVTTAEDQGNTYMKLLCMAFDLALLIQYSQKSFFRFVYHDGILEGLDDRIKIRLLSKVKSICEKYNIQYILSTIDSDIPYYDNGEKYEFSEEEISLELNDKDDSGKLFLQSF